MKKFGGLRTVVPEELVSWARLWRSAGAGPINIAAFSILEAVNWTSFHTNDLDCFGTGPAGDTTPLETNTIGDDLLVIKKAGIYIVDYYAGWNADVSPYTHYSSVRGGYGGSSSFDVNIDRRDSSVRGLVTEGIRDVVNYGYHHVRKILSVNGEFTGGNKGYIIFSVENAASSAEEYRAGFASVLRIPSPSTVNPVVFS